MTKLTALEKGLRLVEVVAKTKSIGLRELAAESGWFLALFFGFWILYITAISNVDLVVRQSTEHA